MDTLGVMSRSSALTSSNTSQESAGGSSETPIDATEFRAAYDEFAGPVLAFLKARSPRGIDAGDIAQESWLRAYRAWHRFEEGNRKAWLLQIARNCLTDEIRRRARTSTQSLESDVTAPAPESVEETEDMLAMRECLKLADSEFATVLRARIYEGRAVEDIARDLGIATATVYTRVNRAKKQIADCVESKRGGPDLS